MPRKKTAFQGGKSKKYWKKHISLSVSRYKRYDDGESLKIHEVIPDDVYSVLENCIKHVELSLDAPKSVSYEKLAASSKYVELTTSDTDDDCSDEGSFVVIDIRSLQENLDKIAGCRLCGASLTIQEDVDSRHGLGTKLEFICSNEDCSLDVMPFHSTPMDNKGRYMINSQLVLASRTCGVGRSGACKFLSILNLGQPLSHKPWVNITRFWEDLCLDIRDESCKKARTRVASIATSQSESNVNSDGSVNIATGFDGSWKTRGHSSSEGVTSAVAELTSQVVDVHHLVNTCRDCHRLKEAHENGKLDELTYLGKVVAHNETCRFNHAGSSQSMESTGTIEIYKRSTEEKLVRYLPFIGDGDSSAFTRVKELKPYGPDVPLAKDECHVHVVRRMGRALRKLKESMKGENVSGKGKFTNAIIQAIQNFYGWAIRENKGDAEKMSRAVWAILGHYQESPDHTTCPNGPSSWCSYQRDLVNGTNTHREIKNPIPTSVVTLLIPIFETLGNVEFLKGCERVATQNPNESFHHVIWNMARKDVYNSPSETSLAVNSAVGIYNDGFLVTLKSLFVKANIPTSENMRRSWEKIDEKRVKGGIYKDSEEQKKKRKTRRRLKHQRDAAFKRKEDSEYKTSAFHENENNVSRPPNAKKKRTSCKCGATTHVRISNILCPMNKKANK